jgi:hypothetical protein
MGSPRIPPSSGQADKREKLRLVPPMLKQKLPHPFAVADSPTVPEQKDLSVQALKHVVEKGSHIQTVETTGVKLCIERQALPLERKNKGVDGRDPR